MTTFYIEMGQGIVGRADICVSTSALYTCTLIAGHNAASGYAGAYHYGANALASDADARADMDVWVAILRPTAVTLVFAPDPAGNGVLGTPHPDKVALRAWVASKCHFAPAEAQAAGAGMELLVATGFAAGPKGHLHGNFDLDISVDVHARGAGTYLDYGRYTLIGRDRN
jgi:hypothetical protein